MDRVGWDRSEVSTVAAFGGVVTFEPQVTGLIKPGNPFQYLDRLVRMVGNNEVTNSSYRMGIDQHELARLEGRQHAGTLHAKTPPTSQEPGPPFVGGVSVQEAV